jgi:hypothetical protein
MEFKLFCGESEEKSQSYETYKGSFHKLMDAVDTAEIFLDLYKEQKWAFVTYDDEIMWRYI